VNQILAKQLHTSDQDILAYTTASVEKLEQVRIFHPSQVFAPR
jgi:vacuolar protein sorting-associated protein VTA1